METETIFPIKRAVEALAEALKQTKRGLCRDHLEAAGKELVLAIVEAMGDGE